VCICVNGGIAPWENHVDVTERERGVFCAENRIQVPVIYTGGEQLFILVLHRVVNR
jgi:hypothetical protein